MQTKCGPEPLDPISGKCSIAFQSCPELVHDLKHADPASNNVFTSHFKLDGQLWLWQQIVPPLDNNDGKYWLRRTLIYEANQIKSAKVDCHPASPLKTFRIQIEFRGQPASSFESTTIPQEVIQESELNSANFPIQITPQTEEWKYLTLMTEAKSRLKNFCITDATALLLGSRSYHRSVDQETWIREQYNAVAAEADYTAKKTQTFKNVRAECVRELRSFSFRSGLHQLKRQSSLTTSPSRII